MDNFNNLGLDQKIVSAITKMGFEKPTAVQEKIIPILLTQQRDIVALAQTGTGKTAAFGLPILNSIDTDSKYPQALILSPTRELCKQITADLKNYGSEIENLKIADLYGGAALG